jgi:ABC-type spermidine/putrescine transport system permease subunit I
MLLGGGRVQTLPTVMVQQLMGGLLWPFGAALALTLSFAVLASIWAFVLLGRKRMRGLA